MLLNRESYSLPVALALVALSIVANLVTGTPYMFGTVRRLPLNRWQTVSLTGDPPSGLGVLQVHMRPT